MVSAVLPLLLCLWTVGWIVRWKIGGLLNWLVWKSLRWLEWLNDQCGTHQKVDRGLSWFHLSMFSVIRFSAHRCNNCLVGCMLGDVTIVYDDVINNATIARGTRIGIHLVIEVFRHGGNTIWCPEGLEPIEQCYEIVRAWLSLSQWTLG